MKKMEKKEEAIKYYIQASEHEYAPIEFQGLIQNDIRLNISKIFIIFYTNLKLAVNCYVKSELIECKKYFLKSFERFIDLSKNHIQFLFEYVLKMRGNLFSILKFHVFFNPIFNFINQPNLISKDELFEIINQSKLLVIIVFNKNETKETCKCDYKKEKENEGKKKINFDEDLYEMIKKKCFAKKLIQNNADFIHSKEVSKCKNVVNNEKEEEEETPTEDIN